MSVFPFPLISDGPPRSSSLTAVRAIFRICGGTDVFGPDKRQTATIISIAHMTEWSAELIANKIHEYFGTETSAEIVWDTYKYWEDVRSEMHPNGPTLGEDLKITKDMVCILRQHEIMPNFHARPLSQTPRPMTVPFSSIWFSEDDHSVVLCDFTERTRVACLKALLWRAKDTDLATPVRQELLVMDALGGHVTAIMKDLLRRWTDEQSKRNGELPFTRAIEESLENIQIIEKYAKLFKENWECVFGIMDWSDVSWLPVHSQPPFYRNLSTGDASITFFRLMLVTRLQAMEQRRLAWRMITAFREVSLKKLPKDLKDCHICQQPLGVCDEDGKLEMPIQVLACCGNYFGGNCLRRWYGEFENKRCPLCNWTASTTFLDQLCYEDMIDEDDEEDLNKAAASERTDGFHFDTSDVDDDLGD